MKQLRIKNFYYGDTTTHDTDIQSWVEDQLSRGGEDDRLGIEEQIEENRSFLAFLADFLVQTGRLDPKVLVRRLCYYGEEDTIEIIEEGLHT